MAIAAHLDETPKLTDAPREPRRKLRLEVEGKLASGGATNVQVHNISTTGLLLESAVALAVGERIEVDLPHAGPSRAKVIWSSGKLFGCQFHTPISNAALSAAQLRGASGEGATFAEPAPLPQTESFGLRIQRLRKARKLSLAQVAGQLGVTKPTVWAWEQGKARPIEERIEALAEALGVTSEELQPDRNDSSLQELLARCREQIARAVGGRPEKIRIMIDL